MLRGGAFKPRTSPYDFQGLKADGIELLLEAKRETGLPIVTEIMNANHLPLFEDVDVIQVGARNMQNFELLKELGKTRKPILLKRGLANTIKELLMSAEYIMASGNENVILCERGIRTFETATRNTLDLSAVPVLHELTHLPVIVDPSHATGVARYVKPMALAAAACGADGLIIEVHNDPPHALCDGAQSLRPEQFEAVAKAVRRVQAAAHLAKAAGARGMLYGQELDKHYETVHASESELLELHAHKTGALIIAGVDLGCDAAQADDALRTALQHYAAELGLVFQIVDDILDVTATTEELGKPVGSDAENDKTTFITLYGLEGARSLAKQHNDAALAALADLGPEADFLREMAVELLTRSK